MKKNVGNVCVTVALVCLALVVVFAWLGCVENSTALLALSMAAGAGFVVAYAGDIMTMPGLPKVPAAEKIDVDSQAVIHGLF